MMAALAVERFQGLATAVLAPKANQVQAPEASLPVFAVLESKSWEQNSQAASVAAESTASVQKEQAAFEALASSESAQMEQEVQEPEVSALVFAERGSTLLELNFRIKIAGV